MPINRKSIPNRRILRFDTIADILADLEQLELAHRAGTLRHLGNWPAGSLFEHLGHAAQCSFDGFDGFTFPLYLRLFAPPLKKWILNNPFPAGYRLTKQSESKAWKQDVQFEEGLRYYRAQLARVLLNGEPNPAMNQRHPSFGYMEPHEWVLYELRHAELHLGFLRSM